MPISSAPTAASNSAESNVVTYAAALTAGSVLLAFVSVWGGHGTTATISDSASHSWTPFGTQIAVNGFDVIQGWWAPNAGTTTPTVTFGGVGSYNISHVQEWTGVDTTTPMDVSRVSNTGNSAAASSGDITPVTAGSMLVAAMMVAANGSITPEGGWTEAYEYNDYGNITTLDVAYKLQSSIVTEDCDWTNTSSPWGAFVVALRPASGGGGGTTHTLTSAGTTTTTGAAGLVRNKVLASAGTTTTTGAAPINATRPLASAGTTTTAGAAPINVTRPLASAGTTTTAGAAGLVVNKLLTAAGTTTTDGAAAPRLLRVVAAAGTTTTTGAAGINATRPMTASGSTTTTAAAAIELVTSALQLTASGSTTTTGSAALVATRTLASAGEATLAGSAALTAIGAMSASGSTTSTAGAAVVLVVAEVIVPTVVFAPRMRVSGPHYRHPRISVAPSVRTES